jgi:hypothetical protein
MSTDFYELIQFAISDRDSKTNTVTRLSLSASFNNSSTDAADDHTLSPLLKLNGARASSPLGPNLMDKMYFPYSFGVWTPTK